MLINTQWKEIRSYSNEDLCRIEYTEGVKHTEMLCRKKQQQHGLEITVRRDNLTIRKKLQGLVPVYEFTHL